MSELKEATRTYWKWQSEKFRHTWLDNEAVDEDNPVPLLMACKDVEEMRVVCKKYNADYDHGKWGVEIIEVRHGRQIVVQIALPGSNYGEFIWDGPEPTNEVNNMYVVIQKGVCIFGTGKTKEEAVADAKEWLDRDAPEQDWDVEDFPSYCESDHGDLVLVPATPDLVLRVQDEGGDVAYVVRAGVADLNG